MIAMLEIMKELECGPGQEVTVLARFSALEVHRINALLFVVADAAALNIKLASLL